MGRKEICSSVESFADANGQDWHENSLHQENILNSIKPYPPSSCIIGQTQARNQRGAGIGGTPPLPTAEQTFFPVNWARTPSRGHSGATPPKSYFWWSKFSSSLSSRVGYGPDTQPDSGVIGRMQFLEHTDFS